MTLSVTGEMPADEMWKSSQTVARSVYGHGKWLFVVLILVVLAVYWLLVQSFDDTLWSYQHPNLTGVGYVLMMIGLCIGAVFLFNGLLKAKLRKRGERASFPLTFSIEDRGLRLTTALSESVTFWPSFGEVTHDVNYWILIVERSAFVLPKRFFATAAAERAFVGAIWERLDEKVRARSHKAAAFLAT